uniref:hypothetical protein n=1 Tax=Fluoribacter dumoffii TaxID=463 RepID=UPI000318FABF|nr:hypothetical protein [Fluoribacter dumoffii]
MRYGILKKSIPIFKLIEHADLSKIQVILYDFWNSYLKNSIKEFSEAIMCRGILRSRAE